MIPLRDVTRRPAGFPLATALIIAVNVVVFLFELAGGEAFVTRWSVIPADIVGGHHHWVTILTAMFMHASWSHIIGNMVFLWAFGPEIEEAMTAPRYAMFYLLGGVVSMLAQVAVSPSSSIPCLGASGAIAAVMGAFIVTFPHDNIRTLLVFGIFVRVTAVPAVLLIGLWFLVQLVSLGTVTEAQSGGVAYVAHIAGMIFGAVTARLFEPSARFAER